MNKVLYKTRIIHLNRYLGIGFIVLGVILIAFHTYDTSNIFFIPLGIVFVVQALLRYNFFKNPTTYFFWNEEEIRMNNIFAKPVKWENVKEIRNTFGDIHIIHHKGEMVISTEIADAAYLQDFIAKIPKELK
ncbi:MAG: hypothetical protein Q4F57_08820 [Weeksellaceae bacterium]|nr:hypothetical protein [Weeksellaceae bacterium]